MKVQHGIIRIKGHFRLGKVGMGFLFFAILLTSCNRNEIIQPQFRETGSNTGAPLQIMVVFAPGQLGDRGYADQVMKGIDQLKQFNRTAKSDTLDVEFISNPDFTSTLQSLKEWVTNPVNPYYGNLYERRLLVLTEPYMMTWMDDTVCTSLRTADEVLVLKTDESDISTAAARYGLGCRLHGLNISAAASVRRFIRWWNLYSGFYEEPLYPKMNLFRLYDDDIAFHRDSIYEVLSEELPAMGIMLSDSCYFDDNEQFYSTTNPQVLMESGYATAHACMSAFRTNGTDVFSIVDFGSANIGWDYYLIGHNRNLELQIMILDAEPVFDLNRFAVVRRFSDAMALWGESWSHSAVGEMPVMEIHGRWDNYCTDDIPIYNGDV